MAVDKVDEENEEWEGDEDRFFDERRDVGGFGILVCGEVGEGEVKGRERNCEEDGIE